MGEYQWHVLLHLIGFSLEFDLRLILTQSYGVCKLSLRSNITLSKTEVHIHCRCMK